MGAVLESAIERVEPATLLAAVQRAWSPAVGEAIAAEASPVSERDGVVTVACRSSTWAQELELLASQIVAGLRRELPPGTVLEGLRFSAGAENP
jgi:predicted nucleic acid-binding Zn ribbon protein